jgi:hypothetical protein
MGQVEDDGMSRARIEAARTGLRLIARLSTEDNVRAIAEASAAAAIRRVRADTTDMRGLWWT